MWKAVHDLTEGLPLKKTCAKAALKIMWCKNREERKWRKLTEDVVDKLSTTYDLEFRAHFRALLEAEHIAGAQFFDIDEISTPSNLPHTAPTPEIFAMSVGAMGISADDTVVVYDQKNMFSAPRVWLTYLEKVADVDRPQSRLGQLPVYLEKEADLDRPQSRLGRLPRALPACDQCP